MHQAFGDDHHCTNHTVTLKYNFSQLFFKQSIDIVI